MRIIVKGLFTLLGRIDADGERAIDSAPATFELPGTFVLWQMHASLCTGFTCKRTASARLTGVYVCFVCRGRWRWRLAVDHLRHLQRQLYGRAVGCR